MLKASLRKKRPSPFDKNWGIDLVASSPNIALLDLNFSASNVCA